MRDTIGVIATIAVLPIAAAQCPDALSARGQTGRTGAQKTMITIPQSLQAEHKAIHDALVKATQVPGPIGAAAKELAAVLDPQKEKASAYEQFAEELALHARTEEEVLYPAAILVGDIIRARLSPK